jgi:long-chain fatty acid transport protein
MGVGTMGKTKTLISTSALVALIASGANALAGGFAVREQSAWGEGSSYAGVAAGGSTSAMFWNPATMTQTGKMSVEQTAAFIFPQSSQTGHNNLPPVLGFTDDFVPNSGRDGVTFAGYTTIKLTDNIWAGFALGAPFGLTVGFQNPNWTGAFYGQSSWIRTYNGTPTIAIKLTDWLSFGAGFQIQYAQTGLQFESPIPAVPLPAHQIGFLSANGWGYGWTAGVTVTPTPWTQIGLGYRSAIDQKLDGTLNVQGVFATPGPISTTVKLPDTASLGIRQGLTTQLTALGTVEWSGWKRIGTVNILQSSGAPALATSGAAVTLPFQYRDGWFYSAGLEYAVAPAWTLRGGVGFERSPISDQVRDARLPDNDRMWYSVGLTNKLMPGLAVDLAYSFIDVKGTPVNVGPGNPWFNGTVIYTGTAATTISIISIGVKYKLDEPPPAVATRG